MKLRRMAKTVCLKKRIHNNIKTRGKQHMSFHFGAVELMAYRINSVIGPFSFQINNKNKGPSYKTDIVFGIGLVGNHHLKAEFHKTN